MTMKLSDNGANFIASHEGGFKLAWYKLNDGVMTVGAGHTISLSEAKKKGITVGTKITKTQAIKWFEEDCAGFVNGTNRLLQQFGFKVNQNQFDALVSYAYNRGIGSSKYDNGLYQLLHHSKNVADISKNFLIYWGTNTYYKKGLMNRRNAEKKLFDTPAKSKVTKTSNPVTTVKNNDIDTLVGYLNSKKIDSSYTNREKLAKKYGIKGYKGTYGQNTQLLNLIKKDNAKSATKKKDNSDEYYATNPKKVKLLKPCNLYSSVEFNKNTFSGLSYPKDTIFTVQEVKKSKSGTPRLIVSNGKYVITANKNLVKKI